MLTVLGRGPNYKSPGGATQGQWWCICDCPEHNIVLVRTCNLRSGNSKSCNCLNLQKCAERIKKVGQEGALDLTGKIFGELKALYPTEERRNKSIVWVCRCSCGTLHKAAAKELQRLSVSSCGCKSHESKGIRTIKKILNENNIPYELEKTYSDCIFPDTKAHARYDFYINNTFLLEFDGMQHFTERDFFRDTLESRQAKDKYKNEYALEHNIPLYRIPYTEEKNLSLELLTDDRFLVRSA